MYPPAARRRSGRAATWSPGEPTARAAPVAAPAGRGRVRGCGARSARCTRLRPAGEAVAQRRGLPENPPHGLRPSLRPLCPGGYGAATRCLDRRRTGFARRCACQRQAGTGVRRRVSSSCRRVFNSRRRVSVSGRRVFSSGRRVPVPCRRVPSPGRGVPPRRRVDLLRRGRPRGTRTGSAFLLENPHGPDRQRPVKAPARGARCPRGHLRGAPGGVDRRPGRRPGLLRETRVTGGMDTLVREGLARLAGKNSSGVFHLKQAMGGGKTHLLVGQGLLAKHPDLRERVAGHMPHADGFGTVRIAAFNGRNSPRTTSGASSPMRWAIPPPSGSSGRAAPAPPARTTGSTFSRATRPCSSCSTRCRPTSRATGP